MTLSHKKIIWQKYKLIKINLKEDFGVSLFAFHQRSWAFERFSLPSQVETKTFEIFKKGFLITAFIIF